MTTHRLTRAGWVKMKRTALRLGLLLALLVWAPGSALGSDLAEVRTIDWGRILRALGIALDSWRLSPFPRPTATDVPTPTATFTNTTIPSTPSRTPTATRTASHTLTPTSTPPSKGQIAFGAANGIPPPQNLASAVLIFPYVIADGTHDTRIELFNMSNAQQTVECFYIRQSDCVEVGFLVTLTALQPLSWFASSGTNNVLTFTAVPPFYGVGELKCAVMPSTPDLFSHNILQGHALAFDQFDGETVGYGAIGFQRLVPGPFPGVVDLDGFTYDQCPDRLHFQVLSRTSGGPNSELVLVPCEQDLLFQEPTETVVQLAIVNEFEQVFSSSFRFECHTSQSFSRFGTLSKAVLGTDTAHVVVRGVSSPLAGLVIDRFDALGSSHTTANRPFLEGGRTSQIVFP